MDNLACKSTYNDLSPQWKSSSVTESGFQDIMLNDKSPPLTQQGRTYAAFDPASTANLMNHDQVKVFQESVNNQLSEAGHGIQIVM